MTKKLLDKNTEITTNNNIFTGKNIVVTGCTGYLGSAFIKVLQTHSCSLTLLSRKKDDPYLENFKNANIVVGDLIDPKVWLDLLNKADYVFHLASLEYNSTNFNHDLDLQLNLISVINLLRTCDENGFSPKIIFTSSSNIAGNKLESHFSQFDYDAPMSIWSLHKLMAEKYLNYYSNHRDIKTICLRFSNVFGPSANSKTFLNSSLNKMIEKAIVNKEITLYSNRHCKRDFLYVDDATEALLLAAKFFDKLQGAPHYYVGSDISHSYYDVFTLIKSNIFTMLGLNVLKKIQTSRMGMFEMRSFESDSSKFRSITGFLPKTSFQEGITRTILSLLKLKGNL